MERGRQVPRQSIGSRVLRYGSPLAAAVVIGVLGGVGFAAMIDMPRIDSLADFEPSLITEALAENGEVFATFARERRLMLADDEVPEIVQQALLAGEDQNFFQHGGVDAEGVARAVLRNFLSRTRGIGGSTLTMQLARKLFLHPKKLWRRKVEEALLAVELEKNYSKQQIMALYCNLMFFGHGNYGIESAARSFFDKPAAELMPHEAATLVGILQRPSDYSPYRRPDLVIARRDYVLRRMAEEGYLTPAAYDAAVEQPLEVVKRRPATPLAPYFAEHVRRDVETRLGTDKLLEGGLTIRTTLDPGIQKAAELAVRDGLVRLDRRVRGWRRSSERIEPEQVDEAALPEWEGLDLGPGVWNRGIVVASDARTATVRLGESLGRLDAAGVRWTGSSRPADAVRPGDVVEVSVRAAPEPGELPLLDLQRVPVLESAVVVLESATGAVRALVGGWDFAASKFNRATQARRQVGSAFKPMVYGAALEAGFSPADTFFDAPAAFEGEGNLLTYSPRNYYRRYFGITTMRRALEQSMNVTAVKVMDLVGVDATIDFARRAGVSSELPPYPSLALGSADLVPLEVAAAYAAIANQGLYVEPYFISEIATPSGQVLERRRTQARKAMDPEIAYVLTHMLEGVIDRGTATAARHLDLDLAGKTGTTDNYSDAWFVGFTPRYTILVWVGHDVTKPIGREMTGAAAALPIWIDLVEAGLEQGWISPQESFVIPPGVVSRQVEAQTGLLTAPGASEVIEEAFVEGTEPVLTYEPRWTQISSLPWYQQREYYLPKARERMPEDIEDWTPILEIWAEN